MQFFLLISLVFVAIEAHVDDLCNNGYTYPSLEAAYPDIDEILYQYHKFNWKCLQLDCPELVNSTLCPVNSDGSLNLNILSQSIKAVQNCFQRGTLICGHPIDPIPLPGASSLVINSTRILPIKAGMCFTDTDVQLQGLSTAEFSLNEYLTTSDVVGITVSIPKMSFKGKVNGQAAVNNDVQFTLPNLPLDGVVSANIKLLLNLDPISFQIFIADMIPDFKIFLSKLPKELEKFPATKLLNEFVGNTVIKSSCPLSLANFLGSFFSHVFEAIFKNCLSPSNKTV